MPQDTVHTVAFCQARNQQESIHPVIRWVVCMYVRPFGKNGCADRMSLHLCNGELAVVCDPSRSSILALTEDLGTTAPYHLLFYILCHASVFSSLM